MRENPDKKKGGSRPLGKDEQRKNITAGRVDQEEQEIDQ